MSPYVLQGLIAAMIAVLGWALKGFSRKIDVLGHDVRRLADESLVIKTVLMGPQGTNGLRGSVAALTDEVEAMRVRISEAHATSEKVLANSVSLNDLKVRLAAAQIK